MHGVKMNYQEMTKKQLDKHAETIGIKLDGRKSKKDMIAELNKKLKAKKPVAKKPVAKKTPAKKTPAKKPVAKKTPAKKTPAYTAPKLSFFDKVKKFFNL